MAYYPFRAKDGEVIEVWEEMENAPEFGERRVVDGKSYFREPSRMQRPHVDKPIRSFQIQDGHPDVPAYDSEGYACFPNMAAAREFTKKNNERLGSEDLGLDT